MLCYIMLCYVKLSYVLCSVLRSTWWHTWCIKIVFTDHATIGWVSCMASFEVWPKVCHVIICNVMWCYVMLSYVVLCYDMLCHAILRCYVDIPYLVCQMYYLIVWTFVYLVHGCLACCDGGDGHSKISIISISASSHIITSCTMVTISWIYNQYHYTGLSLLMNHRFQAEVTKQSFTHEKRGGTCHDSTSHSNMSFYFSVCWWV